MLAPLPCVASLPTLTRLVVPSRPCRKTSTAPLVSVAIRFDAPDWKATQRPSRLSDGYALPPLACSPRLLTLTRVVRDLARSKRNTSAIRFVSPATRLDAAEE